MEPVSSWIVVGFVTTGPQWEILICTSFVVVVVVLSFCYFFGPLLRHMEVPRLGGLIRAVAAGLHHSHSSVGSELHL